MWGIQFVENDYIQLNYCTKLYSTAQFWGTWSTFLFILLSTSARISNLIQIQFFAHKTWQSYKIWYTDLTISNIKYLKLATTVTTMCILLNIKKKICNNDNIMLFFIWWFICINIYFVYCFLFLFFLLISEVRHIFKHYLRLMKLLVITVYWK